MTAPKGSPRDERAGSTLATRAPQSEVDRSQVDQDEFLLAAETSPRRYKSRPQRSVFTGPTARTDTEEETALAGWRSLQRCSSERSRRGQNPGRTARESSTLCSRVRAVRRFLNRLALNHDLGYPTEPVHCIGEPHSEMAFMEEVAGVAFF